MIVVYLFFMSDTEDWTVNATKLFMSLLTLNSLIVGLVSMGKFLNLILLIVGMFLNMYQKC